MDVEHGLRDVADWRRQTGELLRIERELRGLQLEDIADRLKLRASFVAAVEEGRGCEHMDPSYELSHIKSIAAMLGIDVTAPAGES